MRHMCCKFFVLWFTTEGAKQGAFFLDFTHSNHQSVGAVTLNQKQKIQFQLQEIQLLKE